MQASPLRLLPLLAPLLLLACQAPPPEAYVHGAQAGSGKPVAQAAIGKNSRRTELPYPGWRMSPTWFTRVR